MQEKTRVDILHAANLYGSERYTLTVEVINLSDKPLTDINVRALTIPGRSLGFQEDPSYSETSRDEYEEQSILGELNLQIVEAYKLLETNKIEGSLARNAQNSEESALSSDVVAEVHLSIFHWEIRKSKKSAKIRGSSLISALRKLLSYEFRLKRIYFFPFLDWESIEEPHQLKSLIPIWAREATKISSWEDIERAEKIFISQLPEDSFLKQSFFANKEKLKLIKEKAETNSLNLNKKFELRPGQSTSFTFYCKAPNLLHEKKYDAQFETSYVELGNDSQNDLVGVQTVRKSLSFQASNYAIPSGSFFGGISGFLVRRIFLTSSTVSETVTKDLWNGFLIPLLGTILLSWILAIVVRRSDDSKKFITIEDFSGGFFVGSIAGLFSQEILDYLRTLLPAKKSS